MKFIIGKIFVCDGKEWKVLQYEEFFLGFRRYLGFLCKGIKISLKDVVNGIYWIIDWQVYIIEIYWCIFFIKIISLENGVDYFFNVILLVYLELSKSILQYGRWKF